MRQIAKNLRVLSLHGAGSKEDRILASELIKMKDEIGEKSDYFATFSIKNVGGASIFAIQRFLIENDKIPVYCDNRRKILIAKYDDNVVNKIASIGTMWIPIAQFYSELMMEIGVNEVIVGTSEKSVFIGCDRRH